MAEVYLFSCDSLSNLYLWHIKYSSEASEYKGKPVVIRFQICIFDILNTALATGDTGNLRCDSLSNLYLWHIKYSEAQIPHADTYVVIRFQICIFDILNTAKQAWILACAGCDSLSNLYLWHIKYSAGIGSVENGKLWFAFKFVSLTY